LVIPLSTDKVDQDQRMAEKAGSIWKEHGALDYWECIGDDLDIQDFVSFKSAVGAEEGETVIFSRIVYESRDHRDTVNAAVMADPRIAELMESSPQAFQALCSPLIGYSSGAGGTSQQPGRHQDLPGHQISFYKRNEMQ
jgi:uncharacterized protein YbaA (DUF1428 family)